MLLVPSSVPSALAILSASIAIHARLSLGFSIGYVFADRGIVTQRAGGRLGILKNQGRVETAIT